MDDESGESMKLMEEMRGAIVQIYAGVEVSRMEGMEELSVIRVG